MLNRFWKQWPFWIWAIIFLGMCAYGFWGVRDIDFWHSWENAALGSTVLYSILFYSLGFFFRRRVFRTLGISDLGLLLPCMVGAVGCLSYATYVSYSNGSCNKQMTFIFLGSGFFLLVSLIMAYRSNEQEVREDFYVSFRLNDTPVAVAFGLLLVYSMLYHRTSGWNPESLTPSEAQIRAFIGGAIAFQMIISNWIFAFLFRKPGFDLPKEISTNEVAQQ